MMREKFYVTAKFKVKREKLYEAEELMKMLTDKTPQNEEGCIEYYYIKSVSDESEFTSVEIWENEAEEAKHWETEYIQAAMQKLPDLLEELPEIRKWKRFDV